MKILNVISMVKGWVNNTFLKLAGPGPLVGTVELEDDVAFEFGEGGLTGDLGCDGRIYSDGSDLILQVESLAGTMIENPLIKFQPLEVLPGVIYAPLLTAEDPLGIMPIFFRNVIAAIGLNDTIPADMDVVHWNYPQTYEGFSFVYDSGASKAYLQSIGSNIPLHIVPSGNLVLDTLYVDVASYIRRLGDTNTYMHFAGDMIEFYAGGRAMLKMYETFQDYIVFNEDGYDVDFRVESEDRSNAFYLNAHENALLINTGLSWYTQIKNIDYTAIFGDHIIWCVGAIRITLPKADVQGQQLIIKNMDAGVVTVVAAAGQTIDGAATYDLLNAFDSIIIVAEKGVGWAIIASHP